MLSASGLQAPSTILAGAMRCVATSAVLNAQLPATSPRSSTGFLSFLFGAKPRITTPMTEPIPDVLEPTAAPIPTSPTQAEVTTLPSGVRIATRPFYAPTASLAMLVGSGSSHEPPLISGASHLMEQMAFKTTKNRSHFRIVREMEAVGASVAASASREQMCYTMEVVKTNLQEGIEMLTDSVLNPKFQEWEVAAEVKRLQEDISNLQTTQPQVLLGEALNTVAFSGGLGQPLLLPAGAQISAEALQDFHSSTYIAPRIVLSAAGVDHKAFVSMASDYFCDLPPIAAPQAPASVYKGGDFRLSMPSTPGVHSVLAFACPGWMDVSGSSMMTMLNFLMGGGGSFSAGGPGKGMHSRLYKNVLVQNAWVDNCNSLSMIYDHTGLFGVSCSTPEGGNAGRMVDIMCTELLALAKGVSEEELERAKQATTSAILMALETPTIVADDLGRQLLTYGQHKAVDEFLASIKKVTSADISSAVSAMLKKPPSLASIGNTGMIPSYEQVARRFN